MTGCSGVPHSVRTRHIRYKESQPLQPRPGQCLWMQVFLSWSQSDRRSGVHATGVSRCEPCGIFKPPSEVPAGAALPNQPKAASAKAKHVSERKKMRLFNPAYSSSLSPASRTCEPHRRADAWLNGRADGFSKHDPIGPPPARFRLPRRQRARPSLSERPTNRRSFGRTYHGSGLAVGQLCVFLGRAVLLHREVIAESNSGLGQEVTDPMRP